MPGEPRWVQLMTGCLDLDISADEPGDAHAIVRADPPLGVANLIVEDRINPYAVPGTAQQRFQGRPDSRFAVARAGELQPALLTEHAHGLPQPGRGFRFHPPPPGPTKPCLPEKHFTRGR